MGLYVIDVKEDVSGPLFHSNKYSLHYCPGFSGDYEHSFSISNELRSPIMCNGNSMHAVIFVIM